MKRLVLALALSLAPLPAAAHKVIAAVFPSGTVIEGEIGFSNGDMAADALVEVLGPDGARLGEVTTDGDGFFTFSPDRAVPLTFRADLGAGHVADITMPLEEVEQVLALKAESGGAEAAAARASPAAETSAGKPAAPVAAPAGMIALSAEDKLAIARMVRDEVRPLRREIDAYKAHNSLQTILGGIGYILGLAGIGFYFAARRRLAG